MLMDDDGSSGRAYGTDYLTFDDTNVGQARNRSTSSRISGEDVLMEDLVADKMSAGVTVPLTGAGEVVEIEAVGDTADRCGDDAEAGAHMDCDDVGDEGAAPRASVPEDGRLAGHGSVPADVKPNKKKRQSKSAKRPGGPQGGGYNKARSTAALRVTQRNDTHL